MKNPNQAKNKTAKSTAVVPVRKRQNPVSRSFTTRPRAPLIALASNPLAGRSGFELELDWIGDTMEPEIYEGNSAMVERRTDMTICLNELVLGLLHNGELIFGSYFSSDDGDGEIVQIGFINPEYPPAYYWPKSFCWLYPVRSISMFDKTNTFRRIIKNIEFEVGTEGDFPVPALCSIP